MRRLFRRTPSWALVLEILSMMQVPMELPCTFEKGALYLENSAEAAYILEPYYLPCKVKQFLEYTDERRWITILRHILYPYGWEIVSKEITKDKKKTTLYTVQRNANEVVEKIDVDFS